LVSSYHTPRQSPKHAEIAPISGFDDFESGAKADENAQIKESGRWHRELIQIL
jgi:hypothetical protein